ncbi:MAG: hypothetical protein KDC87_17805, partial [Planctomycetes bacterium]|nr:hypothetical protein [Planctomycetota bacterium]
MNKVLGVLAVVVLAILGFWLWFAPGGATPADAGTAGARDTRPAKEQAAPRVGGPGIGSAATPSGERVELPVQLAKPKLAVFRGRCIDLRGSPLVGVKVRLHGWESNEERMDEHRKRHGAVDWKDPEAVETGRDGRFEIQFDPPPPYQFALDLTLVGHIEMTGRWHAVEPRSVKDFGDISMVAGCTVRGRVEDTTGQPIANASLDVDQYDTPARRAETGIHARRYCHAQSQADGAFLFDRMMSPGQWSLRVSNETVVRPDPMVVPPNTPEWSMTVVVRGRTESPDIRGDVVDEAGVPVRGARLGTEPPGRGYSATMSRRDGVFELRQAKGAPPTVKLRVEREGYEVQVTEKEYAWGTQGVRVTLRAGLDVEVLVTDADTGKPIESYGVIAHPDPAHWRRISSRDGRRRARGEHAGGLATLRGLRRGPYLFLVDPDGDTWRNSGFRNFQVADAGPRRLEVQLSRGISRVVTVQTSRGSPLAGSHVELLEPIGDERVDFTTTCVHPNRSASMSSKHCAQLWAEADTDEAGRATVCAPPGARYVLRIRGPVHQPHIERGVELRKGLGPLVVRVAAGATVTGRVRPAKLVEQLLGPLSTGSSAKPGFRLYRQIADRSEQHPADDSARFLLDKDGKYTITGIPRGSWTMYLCWNLNGRDTVAQLDALEEGATR